MRKVIVAAICLDCLYAASNDAPGVSVALPTATTSIASELRKASDGEVIRLAPGLYRETVVIDKRVTIDGSAGAVIDPSEPLSAAWTPAVEIGPHVLKCRLERTPAALIVDGKVLAMLNEGNPKCTGLWDWKTLLNKGAPLSGFQYIRGCWIWRKTEKTAYMSLGDDDASRHTWSVLWSKDPAITFRNTSGACVTGMTISGVYMGVLFSTGAVNCELQHTRIRSFEGDGVHISDGATGCRVVSNEITRGAYESWAVSADTNVKKEEYEIWQLHKQAGFWDRIGILVYGAGQGNVILSNYIHEVFDGIDQENPANKNLSLPMRLPDADRGTEIAWNRIEDTRDSGMEFGDGVIDVNVHNNHLLRTHGGLRFKFPRTGPFYFHHNIIEDDRGMNIWFSMDSSPAEGYIYHNTIIGSAPALSFSSFSSGYEATGTPRWYILNNLFICRHGYFADNMNGKIPVNFNSSHNVIVGGNNPWPKDPSRDAGSVYADTVSLDGAYHPSANSPAARAGIDLSKFRDGNPLPGCEPGYFTGAAPDAGAFPAK